MNPSSDSVTIVMYHYVKDKDTTPFKNFKFLEKTEFKEQVQKLKNIYQLISMEDMVAAIEGQIEWNRPTALLTFDDGYSDHYEVVLPILEEENVKGSFFPPVSCVENGELLDVNKIHLLLSDEANIEKIYNEIEKLCRTHSTLQPFENYWDELAKANQFDPPKIIFIKRMLQHAIPEPLRQEFLSHLFERLYSSDEKEVSSSFYLSRSQIREMLSLGHHFGSHGYSHRWLNRLSVTEQRHEIQESLQFLNSLGVKKNHTICYPYGGYNSETLQICKELNLKVGLTIKPGVAHLAQFSALELPRVDTKELVL